MTEKIVIFQGAGTGQFSEAMSLGFVEAALQACLCAAWIAFSEAMSLGFVEAEIATYSTSG